VAMPDEDGFPTADRAERMTFRLSDVPGCDPPPPHQNGRSS
jgi:hypothetical protein